MSTFVARKTLRAVNFVCQAPHAQSVCLVGDFNRWDAAAHPMQRQPDRLGGGRTFRLLHAEDDEEDAEKGRHHRDPEGEAEVVAARRHQRH